MSCLIGEDEESKLAWLLRAHQTASTITVSKSFASQGLVSVCITTKKNSQGIRPMVALICSNQSSSQNTSSHEDRQVVLICSNHVIYGIPGMGPHGIGGPGRPLRSPALRAGPDDTSAISIIWILNHRCTIDYSCSWFFC